MAEPSSTLPTALWVIGFTALALAWGAHLVVALHLLWHGPVELGVAAAVAFVVETIAIDRGAAFIRDQGS